MKIAVCVKEVRINEAETINPADRTALETALAIRDTLSGSTVRAFGVCDTERAGALYYALARGVDAIERILPSGSNPAATALSLASRFAADHFDLICCGDETLDNASAMVGPLIAECLELPQITAVVRVVDYTRARLAVERALERGFRELVEMHLPGLIAVRTEATELRYVARRKLDHARQQLIPVYSGNGGRDTRLPRCAADEKQVPPRARVRKKFAPESNLSAAERMKMIMSAGIAAKSASGDNSVLEGDSDYLAEQLFRFLKHHEALD